MKDYPQPKYPQELGYYWYRVDAEHDWDIARLFVSEAGFLWLRMPNGDIPLSQTNLEWRGPIPEPREGGE